MEFIDLKAQYSGIRTDVERRMMTVLEHGRYIMGPEVAELEERLAEYVNVRHCVGVASGTDALLVALMALDVASGDEVITTPFSFIATSEVIAMLGAKPVFVDIDPRTYNLDPVRLEQAITDRTKVIMPVSLYGQCADYDRINEIAARHGIPVIEDAAQSLGATYKGRRSCALTTIGCTSFFPSKPLGCYGDGGACFTNDERLAKRMREIRVHGQERRYYHPVLGINGRLDTIQAAVLLAKLTVFPREVEARARLGSQYTALLQGLGLEIVTPVVEQGNTSVYAQYTVQVDGRDAVAERLKAAGIPTAVHYPVPLHLQPAFSRFGGREGNYPIAENAARSVLSLPMHPYLEVSDLELVVASFGDAMRATGTCCPRQSSGAN